MIPFRLVLSLAAVTVAFGIGLSSSDRAWPSLTDREVWTPGMVERRAQSDMDRHAETIKWGSASVSNATMFGAAGTDTGHMTYPMSVSTATSIIYYYNGTR